MKNTRSIASLASALALLVSLGAEGCGHEAGAAAAAADAGADGSSVGTSPCSTNADCASSVPATTPAGCAIGTCDTLRGACAFAAADLDGDGHTAANCTSTNGVPIQEGDDCNDGDPALYPGHPEPCATAEDGGAPPAGLCAAQVSCDADGTESACIATKTCPNGQACVGGACAPGCNIDGTVYAAGQANPSDACQSCDLSNSSVWTSLGDGQSCGTGLACIGGVCGAQCFIAGQAYPAGTSNPTNSCLVCVPDQDTGNWSNAPAGTTCGAGEYCTAGTCAPSCFIAGQVYAAGATNLNNGCQVCTPADSATSWTSEPNGFSCGNGQVCAAGLCGTQCDILAGDGGALDASADDAGSGTIEPTGTLNPANPCQSCQPGTSTSSWSNIALGTSCGVDMVCNDGAQCISGCSIAGSVYAAGATNPQNKCQTCVPATSTTAWVNATPGSECSSGAVCVSTGTTIACDSGCYIAGTYYAPGTVNPTNPCQSCQPGTTGWADLPPGPNAGCPSNSFCDQGACTAGCRITTSGVVSYADPYPNGNSVDPTNPCMACQPAQSNTSYTALADGPQTGCNTGSNFCHSGSCQSGCFIGGTFEASGAVNGCDYCNTGTPTAWSVEAKGYGCASESFCDGSGNCTFGCFIGGGVYTNNANNPADYCQYCVAASNSWADWPTSHACGTGGHCDGAGSCVGSCLSKGNLCTPTSDCCSGICTGYSGKPPQHDGTCN